MGQAINSFLSIDFETANASRVSACSLGVVKVINGEIVSEKSYLINPVGEYSRVNTAIHGINFEHTKDAPTFDKLFKELEQDFENLPVLCYSSFDRSVFETLADHYNLRLKKDVLFVDVYEIAKRAICGLPNYKLPTVAFHLHLPYAQHHDAKSDAMQCAKVFLSLSNTADITVYKPDINTGDSFVELIEDIVSDGVVETYEAYQLRNFLCCIASRGRLYKVVYELVNEILEDGVVDRMESDLLVSVLKYALTKLRSGAPKGSCSECGLSIAQRAPVEETPSPLSIPDDFTPKCRDEEIPLKYKERWEYVKNHPFKTLTSANVVITEDGVRINRVDAESIVKRVGATLKSSTTRDVDFCVVLGMPVECCNTGKVLKAKCWQEQGSPIRIISEDEFINLIHATVGNASETAE